MQALGLLHLSRYSCFTGVVLFRVLGAGLSSFVVFASHTHQLSFHTVPVLVAVAVAPLANALATLARLLHA